MKEGLIMCGLLGLPATIVWMGVSETVGRVFTILLTGTAISATLLCTGYSL